MPHSSTNQPSTTPALAELKTPEGTFLIQERRAVPRETVAAPVAQQPARSSSPAMTALGGLIIIGVLVGSYTTKYDTAIGHAGGPLPVPVVGFLALQLFLARAAYRLFHDVRQTASLAEYLPSRLLRYLPAVIPAVILGFVLVQFATIPGFHAPAASLPANLGMMSDMIGVADIDSSHWRLKIEIILSGFIAFTWFSPMRRHLGAILLVGLGLSALHLSGEPARQNTLTLAGLATADGYLPLFAFGIALYQLTQDRVARIWWAVVTAAVVLAFLSNTPWHGACVVAALGVLAAIVLGRLQVLGRSRILVFLGDHAFPIYVVHYVMGFALIHRMELDGFNPLVAILTASALAVTVGKIVNVLFEKPAVAHGMVAIEVMNRMAAAKYADGRRAGAVFVARSIEAARLQAMRIVLSSDKIAARSGAVFSSEA